MAVDPVIGYWIAAVLWGLACWVAAFATAGMSPLFAPTHKLAPIEIGLRAVAYGSIVWLAVALLQLPGTASRLLAASVVLVLAIVETDTRRLLIPNAATAGLIVIAIVSGFLGEGASVADRLSGMALGLAMFWTVRVVFQRQLGREALGWGDVKLAGALGAMVGLWDFPTALLVACGITAAFFIAKRGLRLHSGAPAAPLGVGLAIAGIAVPLFTTLVAR
jgi:leader peptidase (prepilin peptidase) / N-methyltransferase